MQIKELKSYRYAQDVLSGKQMASRYIKMAAERYMHDLERDDLVFDLNRVKLVNNVFEKIIHIPETGKLNVVFPPHAFWLEQLYGFKYAETGIRKYQNVYLQFARKQFKTFYAAGVTLVEGLFWRDLYPEILVGANSREQALICTTKAANIVKTSPLLAKKYDPKNNRGELKMYARENEFHTLTYEVGGRNCQIKAIPRDLGDGKNPSVLIIDEFHEAKSNALLEMGKSGQAQRLEPLNMIITSPGNNRDGVCFQERTLTEKILKGEINDDRHLGMLFELDNEDDWDNINVLEQSNPMMPYTATLKSYLEDRLREAKKYGGSTESNVKIKNCGIWVDAPEIWVNNDVLIRNNEGPDIPEGAEVYVGFDLAKGTDLNALAIIADIEGKKVVKMHYWMPTEKYGTDNVDYERWVKEGYINVQEGNVVNFETIGNDIVRILEKYYVKSIGYDSRYANMGVVPILVRNGYEDRLVPTGQGFTLSPATLQVEHWLKEEKLNLQKNPVLLWNFRNVSLNKGSKGDVYPDKMRSSGKIDGVVALCMAILEWQRFNSEYDNQVYEFILLQ